MQHRRERSSKKGLSKFCIEKMLKETLDEVVEECARIDLLKNDRKKHKFRGEEESNAKELELINVKCNNVEQVFLCSYLMRRS